MIIIFGFRRTVGQHWQGLVKCPYHGNWALWSGLRIRRWFTLFFIPVIPFWSDWIAKCDACGYAVKFPHSEWKAIGNGAAVLAKAWELQRMGQPQEAIALLTGQGRALLPEIAESMEKVA